MRTLGILFLFMAAGLGLIWPWAQINFLGREVGTLEFGALRGPIAERQVLELTQSDNPVRIRFQAEYKIDGRLPPVKIPVKTVITDVDGTLLSGMISFPTQGIETGPRQEKVRGSQPLNFSVINDGKHELFLELAANPNDGGIARPDIAGITATVIANAPAINEDYKSFAAILALAGVYLLVRSRKRKTGNGGRIDPPPRWGRS
ncbi:MAG: hypothetical protein AAFN43_05715 [Pseudomonadota bacterium]